MSQALTRPENHQQCQLGGQCAGQPVVRGHLCPRAYQRKLGTTGQMMVFTKHRAGGFPSKIALPMIDGIANAATGYFTCEDHEGIFAPADQVTVSSQAPPTTTLDLMALRNIMHRRWWNQLWANAAETMAKTEQEDKWLYITELLRSGDNQLLTTQLAIEQCLRNDPIKPPLEHLVFASEGYPVLTAATFGVGLKTDELQPIGTLDCGNDSSARPRIQRSLPTLQTRRRATGPSNCTTQFHQREVEDHRCGNDTGHPVSMRRRGIQRRILEDPQCPTKGAVLGTFDMAGQQEYVGPDIFSGTEWTLIK